jgi:hypothetical protein
MFPFLSLPLELRLQVYGTIAAQVPHTTPMTEFSGFALSCRPIKEEFEKEYMVVYRKAMTDIADLLPQELLQLSSVPTAFHTAQHLTINLPDGLAAQSGSFTPLLFRPLLLPASLATILRLELATLTIQRNFDVEWMNWVKIVLFGAMCDPNKVRCRRLIVVSRLLYCEKRTLNECIAVEEWGSGWNFTVYRKVDDVTECHWERVDE